MIKTSSFPSATGWPEVEVMGNAVAIDAGKPSLCIEPTGCSLNAGNTSNTRDTYTDESLTGEVSTVASCNECGVNYSRLSNSTDCARLITMANRTSHSYFSKSAPATSRVCTR